MEQQAARNADPSNWVWNEQRRHPWELAHKKWQEFYDNWYNDKGNRSAPLFDPELPHLPLESVLLRFNPSISSSIFVRECYKTMFEMAWGKAIQSKGHHGLIITGQPGTGKSLFDYYLLVRLLLQKQVVLFCPEGKAVYLFYFGTVYTSSIDELAPRGLSTSRPKPVKSSSSIVFIWSIFDIRELKEPETFMCYKPCFPVQTTLPDERQYKIWRKERMPTKTGFPLWTREELAQGMKYQEQYETLMEALSEVYGPTPPADISGALKGFPGAFELLQERYGEEGAEPPSPDDAVDYLLDTAIAHFGSSARDVYYGIFDYQAMTKLHQEAFQISYERLQEAVYALITNQHSDSISDRILTLSPVYHENLKGIEWKVHFKSAWVGRSLMQRLSKEQDKFIRQQITFYRRIPAAQTLAGQFLEPLAHRYIAQTAADSPWPLITMVSDDADPPNFTLVRDSPVEGNIIFPKIERKIVKLESTADLPACLGNNRYYVPSDPNFPLFDAFTIEINHAKFAVLWILRMATSQRHGGSTIGYQKIREIIATLKERLLDEPPLAKKKKIGPTGTSGPLVEVRYLLIVPKDKSELGNPHWQFPKGWSENWKKNDHRGKVYCLEFPLSKIYDEESMRNDSRVISQEHFF